MRIGNQEIARVAILVLDYDPYREERPSRAVTDAYGSLCELPQKKHGTPNQSGQDVLVLANEELVKIHQKDFEGIGLIFLPNWQEAFEYRELLRLGLEQGDVYLMVDIGRKGAFGVAFWPVYSLRNVRKPELDITDFGGMIDIRPKQPLYSLQQH